MKNNAELLKLIDKKKAVLLFTKQQQEKQQIDSLKQEIELLQTQLKSNEDEKNNLQGRINNLSEEYQKVEAKQKKELEEAQQFCDKRDKMIEALPPSLRKKAREQFRTLSQYQDEFNTKTVKFEKISTSAGFLARMLHGKKLAEFDTQFDSIKKNMEIGEIRNFDVSEDFSRIAKDINRKYSAEKQQLKDKMGERQTELAFVDKNINNDKTTLQNKETLLAQNEKSLEDKVNQFSSVYDTHPFVDTKNIDPVVQKAIDNGQILGSEREVQVLSQLLTMGCQNSDIAKEVLSAAIDKGTKYIISEQKSGVGGHYGGRVVSIDRVSMNYLDTDSRKVKAIATLVHESRHACQDTGENIIRNNWANTFIQSSLNEVDAYSIEVATMYQMNQKLGTNVGKEMVGDGHAYMLKAFSDEYEQNHDICKALNKAALEWDKHYGYDYKIKQYISENWCHLAENAETIHPEEIAKRNDITFKGKFYLDIEKVTEQILTIDKNSYDTLKQKLELSGEKDDSLQYFTVKTPEFRKDEKGNILQDKYGFDIIDYKTTPPTKKFVYSAGTSQTNLSNEKIQFNDMTLQQRGAFIQNELRQGNNSFLTTDTKPITPTREKSVEKSKITPLIRINRGMEI